MANYRSFPRKIKGLSHNETTAPHQKSWFSFCVYNHGDVNFLAEATDDGAEEISLALYCC
jgi:hypothetical protein